MANWSNPLLTSTYTNFLAEVKDRDTDLALQFDGTTSSNIPTGAIRWNSNINGSGGGRWQKWNGSGWGELTSTYALTGLTTTGNATIGGTLGSGAFTSSGTVTGTALLPTGNTVPANGIYLPSANTLGIATATTCRILVASDGKVGIGTLSPATGLHVATAAASATSGNLLVAPPSADQARIRLSNQGGQAEWIFGQKTSTDHDFKLSKSVLGSESDYFTINTSGNVGIGGPPTAVKLYVNGQIVGTGSIYGLRASNGGGTGQTTIGLTREGAATDQKVWELMQGGSGEFLLRTINDTYSASQNAIAVNRGSSYNVDNISLLTMGSSRLYINSSGGVGIGTTSPSTLLHVAGAARIGANDSSDAILEIGAGATGNRHAYIDLIGDTTYSDYGLRLMRSNGGANAGSTLVHRGTGPLEINCQDAGIIEFRINNTARAYLEGTRFKLAGTDITSDSNGGNITLFGGDGTGANIELYGGSHASFANLMVLDAGEHRIRSQDGATDWVRVTSTGRVGIGVTNPAAGFHVGSTAAGASIGNIYIAPTTAGQARYHLYNGGAQAEWMFGQKTSTDHDFKLSTQVAGNEVDRLIVTTDGTLKFNSGYGVNVVATAYGCRAWVNFDGTGTISANQTIRASGNVASVYKNATGDYTVTFTNAMPDANYAVNATLEQAGRDNWVSISDLTTTTFKVYSKDNSFGLEDSPRICITVTR